MSVAVAIPSVPSVEPAPRDYLSWSQINSYRSCPLRYYFRYVAGLPEKTVSASLVFGSAIHRAIEHHFRELLAGNPPPTTDELLDHYQAEWRERDDDRVGSDDNRAALDGLAGRMLEAFQRHDAARPHGRILAVEESLRGELVPGLPDLLGRIDLIVETNDALVISDWKTGRSRWSADQADDNAEQLLLYAELARDFAPRKQVRVEFVVLTKTKEPVVDRHQRNVVPGQVDRAKRIAERVYRAIEAEHFFPSPSPMNCGGCPFREPCRLWPG